MTFGEVQHEIAAWEPTEQRRLMAYLATLANRREGLDATEIANRIDDPDPANWVSLDDARRRLLSDS